MSTSNINEDSPAALRNLIMLVGIELGIDEIKMAKLYTAAVLKAESMKLADNLAEPPQFPDEEL